MTLQSAGWLLRTWAIELWRERQALETTWRKRPDLLEGAELTQEQTRLLADLEG